MIISTFDDLKRALAVPRTFKDLSRLSESNTALTRLKNAHPNTIRIYNPPSTWWIVNWLKDVTPTPDLVIQDIILMASAYRETLAKIDKDGQIEGAIIRLKSISNRCNKLIEALEMTYESDNDDQ